jgi:hypothetical protein
MYTLISPFLVLAYLPLVPPPEKSCFSLILFIFKIKCILIVQGVSAWNFRPVYVVL